MSVLIPVMSPWIPHNPIFVSTVILALTNNWHVMVYLSILTSWLDMVRILIVTHEWVCNNTASKRTSLLQFIHHSQLGISHVCAEKCSPFVHFEVVIRVRYITATSRLTVQTYYFIFAPQAVVESMCLLVWTSLIRQPFGLHLFVNWGLVSTMTAIIVSYTRNHHLWGYFDWGELSLAHDFDTVREHCSGRKCPTRTTVSGNVLVAHCSCVVHAVYVAPVVRVW